MPLGGAGVSNDLESYTDYESVVAGSVMSNNNSFRKSRNKKLLNQSKEEINWQQSKGHPNEERHNLRTHDPRRAWEIG